jgi:hypothetical protein
MRKSVVSINPNVFGAPGEHQVRGGGDEGDGREGEGGCSPSY